jgi:hypothetical protein
MLLIFRRQFYYRMRQIDARNREIAEIPFEMFVRKRRDIGVPGRHGF